MIDLTNPAYLLGIILIAVMLVALIVFYVIPRLPKKNDAHFELAKRLLEYAESVLRAIDTDPKTKNVPELIVAIAQIAVANAEQLYDIGKLPKEERKAHATEYIKLALVDLGIEITPEREKLIDGAIEAMVYLLTKLEKPPETEETS